MDICSIWKIEFLPTSGAPIVLLDFGERMKDEPEFETTQANAASGAMFVPFGSNYALGAATNAASWNRERYFRNNAHARTASLYERQSFPWGTQGSIRVTILNGTTWTYERSALLTMTPRYPTNKKHGQLFMQYRAQLGKPTLSAGSIESIYAPITPYRFWDEESDAWDVAGTWDELIPL